MFWYVVKEATVSGRSQYNFKSDKLSKVNILESALPEIWVKMADARAHYDRNGAE